jgi:hypothetical protein
MYIYVQMFKKFKLTLESSAILSNISGSIRQNYFSFENPQNLEDGVGDRALTDFAEEGVIDHNGQVANLLSRRRFNGTDIFAENQL